MSRWGIRERKLAALLGFAALAIALTPLLNIPCSREARAEVTEAPRHACALCHPAAEAGGHPLSRRPTLAIIPDGWPLDRDGRLDCSTCHIDCGKNNRRGENSGAEFCAECHRAGPKAESRWKHARFFNAVHLGLSTESHGGIDLNSRRCLECHDGAAASFAENSIPVAPGIGSHAASHPIGIAYPPGPRPFADNSYEPRAALDPRLLLDDGKIGCLTCHSLYSSEENLLAISNQGSRLCYQCHRL